MPKSEKLDDVYARIYRIRGKQVMLDSDLAALYGVTTFNLNKAVRRNVRRFPPDFMCQLSEGEHQNLIFQIGISSSWGGRRHRPFAFTQEGIAMLSSVLRSEKAALVNIAIMRAFVKLRHAVLSSRDLTRRVEKVEGKLGIHETDIRFLTQDVEKLKKRLGPEGPINPAIL